MVTKTLTYKFGADYGGLRREMEAGSKLTAQQKREFRDLEAQQRRNRQAITELGQGFLTFGALATVGLGMAVREAIRWESAFAGVKKTVDGSPEQIAELEGELRNLAKTLPASHQEIAAVAEAAGQLGIKRQDVAEFTKTMVDLGETTNLSAEEAATSLAQFMNIMGTSASDVDRLGAALVALGNAGASTEKDIIDMGLRIAGAGRTVGLSEDQVLGFASALSSVGIEAEAGGSAFSRVMIDMASAVSAGGSKLNAFGQVAGMTGSQFAEVFRGDAASAIVSFVQGLHNIQASGGDVFGVLEQLGFSEVRVRDMLLRTAGASDLLSDALGTGARGWAENSALAQEAAKRYGTTESQMQVTANNIKDAAIDIGAAFLPIVQGVVDGVRNLITWFQNLPGPVQTVVAVLGAVTAGVTLFGGAALIAAPKILAFRASMDSMIAGGGAMSGALGKFGKFMVGPWGAAIGVGVALLGAFGMASGASAQRQDDLASAGKSVADAIIEQNGAINESVRVKTSEALAEKGVLQVAKQLGISLPSVTDAVLGQGDAYDEVTGKIQGHIEKLKDLLGTRAGAGGRREEIQGELDQYQDLLVGINGVKDGKEEELLANEAATEGAKENTGANKENAGSTKEVKVSAEEAAKAFEDLFNQMNKLNNTTLDFREAQRGVVTATQELNEAIAKNGTTLDTNTAAGMENEEKLDGLARAYLAVAEAAAKEAEANGGVAAGTAALNNSLEASRQALYNQAYQFFGTEEATWAYVDSVLAIPTAAPTIVTTPGSAEAIAELLRVQTAVRGVPPGKDVNVDVISESAKQKLEEVGYKVTTLPDGTVVVNASTAGAQQALDEYISSNTGKSVYINVRAQLIASGGLTPEQIGKAMKGLGNAYGGIVQYAAGGIEDHRPMVARARPGMVRMWAEPETHAESYIPWAPDRRGRANAVLAQTADAFGWGLVPKGVAAFAGGGIYGGRAAGTGGMACEVRVFVGDREITDIVRTEVVTHDRALKRAASGWAGGGG